MKFKLIMVFTDIDKTDKLLDAARQAGATGATIISSAKGQGLDKAIGIFGLELLNPRDVILVLVEKRRADHVLETIVNIGGLDEKLDTGIAIMLDVERALGLTEHIRKLQSSIPVE